VRGCRVGEGTQARALGGNNGRKAEAVCGLGSRQPDRAKRGDAQRSEFFTYLFKKKYDHLLSVVRERFIAS
jgi:hypothetical protein